MYEKDMERIGEKIIEKAWLYKFVNNGLYSLKVFEGSVWRRYAELYEQSAKCVFLVEDGRKNMTTFACGETEGVLYDKGHATTNVWLTKNNVDEAKSIFVETQEKKIDNIKQKCDEKIKSIEYAISMFK